jgi:PAS domain S-box-containing protein
MLCNPQLESRLEALSVMESLFDDLEDVAFFIKDEEGRYVIVNRALVTRCGFSRKQEVVGRTTDEVYPAPFGDQYREQDRLVLETDTPIKDKLELQLYVEGAPGWCLTNKVPIHGDDGSVVGMTGLSRDLHIPKKDAARLPGVSRVVDHIWAHYDEQLRVEQLAAMADLSAYQLEQRMKRIFHVTVGQFIMHARIDVARDLLRQTTESISEIAQRAGFYDQSAFTRHFKAVTELTPGEFRSLR